MAVILFTFKTGRFYGTWGETHLQILTGGGKNRRSWRSGKLCSSKMVLKWIHFMPIFIICSRRMSMQWLYKYAEERRSHCGIWARPQRRPISNDLARWWTRYEPVVRQYMALHYSESSDGKTMRLFILMLTLEQSRLGKSLQLIGLHLLRTRTTWFHPKYSLTTSYFAILEDEENHYNHSWALVHGQEDEV